MYIYAVDYHYPRQSPKLGLPTPDYLQSITSGKINDPDEARNLIQDTFLSSRKRLESFKDNGSERAWLTGILLHKIIDLYRKLLMEKEKQLQIIRAQMDQQTRNSDEELFMQKGSIFY